MIRTQSTTESTLRFSFDGRSIEARRGDTIAVALHRHGVRALSISVKYRRPRGLFCARGRCVMCLVEADGLPGVRACTKRVHDGMVVRTQDHQPFYGRLLAASVRHLPFPAGFYFRFFTRPALVRRMFLATLRRMAGVARLPTAAPLPPTSPVASPLTSVEARYDVIVVGAGLSGLTAAAAAAERGSSVLLVDEYSAPGGHRQGDLPGAEQASLRDRLSAAVGSAPTLSYLPGVSVHGFYSPATLLIGDIDMDRGRGMRRVSARAVVFATGTMDVVPLFENNDLPGVIGMRALRLVVERDGYLPFRRPLVYGESPHVEEAVAFLQHHGVEVAAAENISRARLRSAHARPQAPAHIASARLEAEGGIRRVECDGIVIAMTGQPLFELLQQAGFALAFAGDAPLADGADARVLFPVESFLDSTHCRRYVVGSAASDEPLERQLEMAAAAGRSAAQ